MGSDETFGANAPTVILPAVWEKGVVSRETSTVCWFAILRLRVSRMVHGVPRQMTVVLSCPVDASLFGTHDASHRTRHAIRCLQDGH
jgi:hypothetical protein